MDAFLSALAQAVGRAERLAAAFVIRVTGSTPQKPGAAMLVNRDGRLHGTVGGGVLEAEAIRRAQQALVSGVPDLFSMTLDDECDAEDALWCGGTAEVFVLPLSDAHCALLHTAHEALTDGRATTLIVGVESPAARPHGALLLCDEHATPLAGDADALPAGWREAVRAARACAPRATQTLDLGGGGRIALRPIAPRTPLLIVGAGHIGAAVARLAARLDFEVTVLDDRPALCTPARLPDAHQCLVGDLDETTRGLPPRADRFIVIATRSHAHDLATLRAALRVPHAYLGLLGSHRKFAALSRALREDGVSETALAAVQCPVGLSIGAVSPEEIAVSITAQLVQARNLPAASEAIAQRTPQQVVS